jgi:hypothetical protein
MINMLHAAQRDLKENHIILGDPFEHKLFFPHRRIATLFDLGPSLGVSAGEHYIWIHCARCTEICVVVDERREDRGGGTETKREREGGGGEKEDRGRRERERGKRGDWEERGGGGE